MPSLQSYQRLYDRMAPFYGPAMGLFPMWRRYIEAVLPWLDSLTRDAAVLEIGPGPGWLLERLAGRYRLAAGLDLSAGMLRQAQQRLGRAKLPARLAQSDATRLPFVDGSFDAIVLTFTFSAIPDGLAALREMARVLKPGGLLVLVDAGEPGDGNLIGLALARTWQLFDDFMRDEAELMREAGLEIVERREFGAFDGIRLVVGRKPCEPVQSFST